MECVSYSKSVDFQKDRKSWPLAQVVECVALDTVSHISPSESENERNVVDSVPSHNGCITDFQAENVQTDLNKELCFDDSPTNNANNVLKIVLPLVSKNVPLSCLPITDDEHDELSKLFSVNNHVQYSSDHCVEMPVNVKHVNNRNHSLPEDSELNRFSSTFENIKTLLKEGLVDGLDEMPPDFLPPNPPLLYRVSSLPNLLSHDSTKNHNSCSYLTMCATKHELIMNKLCKNIVAKHDMSVQVSTELFKTQNEKILVDTSCQTEDIFVNCLLKNEVLTKETDQNVCHTRKNTFDQDHEMKTNADNEIQCDLENDCVSIEYTNINILNEEYKHKTHIESDCKTGYININIFNTECETKTNEEEDCVSFDYSDININHKEHEVNANEEDCTSVGYININAFNTEKEKLNTDDSFPNVNNTKITTFNKESKIKSNTENCANIDYTNMNVIDNGNGEDVNDKYYSKISYTNTDLFDKEHEVKTNGEDCVDIGYTNFRLYDKGLEVDSNDDRENYANANILEEFVNEQLSLNNTDGDFDSFLFGPLPPSPIEETGKIIFTTL